eukprot:m.169417 g.169417  ORF g.169417 m.169417 type:complete len:346 (+) comp31567_c1_seq3:439-1476(+)
MPRNKFMGKKGDYGMNNMTADAFLKVIYRPTQRVQDSFVEVMVLLQKDGFETAVQEAHKERQDRHTDATKKPRGEKGNRDRARETDDGGDGGDGGRDEFEFDPHTIVAKMAIMRHKGFKHKAAGCHGGSNTHIPGVGQNATKGELQEMFGTDDVEECVSVIINEQIAKELTLRAKMVTRAKVYAERQWKSSGLGISHRVHWSVATHHWLSGPRAAVVETVMLVSLRLVAVTKASEEVDGAVDEYAHNNHGNGYTHPREHGGFKSQSSSSSSSSVGLWLPNEVWIVILMHLERTQFGSDANTGVGVCGGSKVRGQTAKFLEEANAGTKSKNYSKKRFKNKQNKSTF